MSIFENHIETTDELLSKWYVIPEGNELFDPWNWDWTGSNNKIYGWMYPKKSKAPKDVYDEGDYCTAEAAYERWRPGKPAKIAEIYHINIRIDKRHYFRSLWKARDAGKIKSHLYKGQYYYNWNDLCEFHAFYEIGLITKYCKKQKYYEFI